MKENKISMFKVAGTYIGTVIGAGFASGQEILQFFAVFGNRGIWGLIAVTILFIIFGYIIMDLGRQLGSTSHLKIIKTAGGKYLGTIIDFIITFFLFGALTAMIAGAGALVNQQFNVPAIWGNLFMAVIAALTVLTGINGVVKSISFIAPFLIITVLGVSISSYFTSTTYPGSTEIGAASGLIKNWVWAAILYTSYNIVLAIAILGPLGHIAESRQAVRNGAILGGFGLGIGAAAIFLALSKNLSSVFNIEVPMVYVAGQVSTLVQIIYIVVLLAEVYTTAVGSLYGFAARLTSLEGSYGKLIIIGSSILAFAASQFGFSNLVKYLYPLVGYGGVLLLLTLFFSRLKLWFPGYFLRGLPARKNLLDK